MEFYQNIYTQNTCTHFREFSNFSPKLQALHEKRIEPKMSICGKHFSLIFPPFLIPKLKPT